MAVKGLSKIDIGADAQAALKELNLFPEKTTKFKADCHSIKFEFAENSH